MTLFRNVALAGLMLASTALTAMAQDLVIGRSTEPSAIDPQFSRTGNNQMTADNIFGTLLSTDENLQMHPALATEWSNTDELTWDITLREGVTFHDGSAFTADDVIFSLERTDEVPNSPAPFTDNVSSIASMEKTGDHSIRIVTKAPNPALMEQVGRVFIISKAAAEGATLDDFNSGKAAIGTGPYRFVSWKPAESLTIERFDDYWGDKPEFATVEYRFITNDAARSAALLSGSVDLIDAVSPSDVATLERNTNIKVYGIESGRLIYLGLSMRDSAPGVTDLAGAPLDSNPFDDARVRKAVSMMIDRQLIIDRILGGAGVASAQIVPSVLGGYAEDLKAVPADPAAAKALLVEAGYPDGFGITIYSSNNRFPGDGDLAQALGQMLARGGLKVNGVETLSYNVYAAAASKGEYGAFVFSLGSSTPNSEANLRSLLQTYNADEGTGGFNRTRYSNADFDKALQDAMQEFDSTTRNEKLAAATRIAMEDQALVPLYFQKVYWASNTEIDFIPNLAERTVASDVRSAAE
ncbi:ABC transporter substrate-binding protein [Falsirhodobacter sp. 1013]|uniref:ABC transporter substrate-binding protein n=1 Tax=Falsirhodobacter sp. 1013 TaxID=3417566 RepID=UPI003EBAEA83